MALSGLFNLTSLCEGVSVTYPSDCSHSFVTELEKTQRIPNQSYCATKFNINVLKYLSLRIQCFRNPFCPLLLNHHRLNTFKQISFFPLLFTFLTCPSEANKSHTAFVLSIPKEKLRVLLVVCSKLGILSFVYHLCKSFTSRIACVSGALRYRALHKVQIKNH